jgi:hypothetical protein
MSVLLETGPSPRGWHRLQNMLECPQKWSYRYNLGLEPQIPAIALMKGSLTHLALAHHYTRKQAEDKGEDKNAILNPYEAVRLKCRNEPEYSECKDLVEDAIEGYQRHWLEENKRWRILEVEKLAYAIIDDPERKNTDGTPIQYLLTGRFDMVIENIANGDIYVVDHKTTSRLSKSHIQYYSMSGQLIGYEYMARKVFGDRMKGIMINFVQLGKKNKYERVVIDPRPNLTAQFEQTVVDAERMITDLEKTGRDPMHYPKAMNELTCYTRYGACPFMDQFKYGISSYE